MSDIKKVLVTQDGFGNPSNKKPQIAIDKFLNRIQSDDISTAHVTAYSQCKIGTIVTEDRG